MNLSLRLENVKNRVITCDTACDIGCDHGYVSIGLIKEKRAKRVIACDINKGPLEACKKNVTEEGLNDYIETRLSDGLSKVTKDDAIDAIVIAGMGGALMTKILTEGIDVVRGAKQLVLQPQSELNLVRKWLRENGYNIVEEQCFVDMEKYYFLMDARPGERKTSDDNQDVYDLYSEYLIRTKDACLKEYLLRGLEVNNGYMEGIEPSKRSALVQKNELIKRALKLYEG